MQSNLFRTIININKPFFSIFHTDNIISIGSCFSENMATQLQYFKFNLCNNPFGITYHPLAIAQQLQEILSNKQYTENDLFQHQELWSSFMHHGSFSGVNKENVLNVINKEITQANQYLKKEPILIITFGTAFAYIHKENEMVVNNCHKLPASAFTHQLITTDEILHAFKPLLDTIKTKIIVTVSPVRHTNISAFENNISKAQLLIACYQLEQAYSNVYYFPSYEIMMDELRDYRFYDKDMLHPNETAVAYIWEQFKNTCIHESCFLLMQQIQQLQTALHHRPRNANSPQHQQFLTKQLQHIELLEQQYNYLSFEDEKEFIEQQKKN